MNQPTPTELITKLLDRLSSDLHNQPANLEKLYNRVEPGFIRVDADEVTYPAHVILRYELERDLMEGRIEVADIPELWDAKMQHPSQWKSARTTNAIERLNEEFRRRIKTQTVLPCAETVPMLLWALLASGQIQMRKVDGWETLAQPLGPMALDLAA